jgi:hypothetical protein
MAVFLPSFSYGEILFEENFDNQPDFTSTMYTTMQGQLAGTHTLPNNWDAIYQGTMWSPETGYPDNHASIEILGSNTGKARGGAGKSMVNWRESYSRGFLNWASDSQMVKLLDRQYDQLYVEFWISFPDNFYGRKNASDYSSKIFRVASWSGEGDIFNGALGEVGPNFIWYHFRGNYGVQNSLSFRGGPWGENYHMDQNTPMFDRHKTLNYGSDTLGQAPGESDPFVLDQVYGGYLKDIDRYTWLEHDQVFGTGQRWTKMAFFVKLNSAPDVTDGILQQWINDQRVVNITNIPWIKNNTDNKMVGWNYFAIGGNDFFQPYANDQRFEDWYAIDDVVVRDSIPSSLQAAIQPNPAPNPPSSVSIE